MSTPVVMPQMGESVTEGTIVRWLKKVGDAIDRDEPLFEISTDKVDAEIPSPVAGVLTEIRAREGETVAVNSVVGVVGAAGDLAAASPSPLSSGPASPPPAVQPPVAQPAARNEVTRAAAPARLAPAAPTARQRVSPLVRRIAKEHHVEVSQIAGSGLDGRVTRDDILAYVERGPMRPSSTHSSSGDRVEPLSLMRKKIAEHMVLSRRTAAHVHSVFHVDFSTIDALRQQKKDAYEKAGTRLTYMAFITAAVAAALRAHPVINASLDGETVIYRADVNVGIAVALESGLIVPVLRSADTLSLLELSRAVVDLSERARTKRLAPEEVHGGTFTITNPGQFGSQFGLPIINQPQVAILAVGTIEKRPVIVDDAVAIRTMAYLVLGFDHRLIDGAVADQFMADVKTRLETFDPGRV
jgi:2-oxoglutarate dehydrogenase E2 component (dihydrolipoamide succinyltransferase)